MPNAEELIAHGDIASATAALQDVIRKEPGEGKHRIFLAQLLCLAGDWKRAVAQLRLSAELDPAAIPMAQTYREAIVCEVFRQKVFAGEADPLVMGRPEPWLALVVGANRKLASGEAEAAAALRDQAFEVAPARAGWLNDAPFDWVADADMRLGPVLEIIVNGKYFWLPFDAMASITFDPPEDLRDLVWAPATLELPNEGKMAALVPVRYPATVDGGDPAELMARKTTWTEAGAGTFVGSGQRTLSTDGGDTALLGVSSIAMDLQDG